MLKRLLTLAAAAAAVSCASAVEFPLTGENPLNWSWGSNYDAASQTITYTGDWGAAGWWLKDTSLGDLSAYTDIEITTEPTGINGWLIVCYTNPDGGDTINRQCDITKGDTFITLKLDSQLSADITGIYLAGGQLNDTPTIKVIKAEAVDNSGKTAPVETKLALTWDNLILSSEFDSLDDDQKVRIHIKNTTDPYESRNGWGLGQISYLGHWGMTDNSFALTGADGEEFDIFCTVADLKKAGKDGTDEYIAHESFPEGGVLIQVYNDCVLAGVWVENKQETSIISSITDRAADGTIYDLQGRKVTNPAKGIYIRDGKKIIIR